MKRRDESFVEQFRQGLPPIVPDGRGLRSNVRNQGREIRLQVVAASALELFQKIARPVLSINFQTIAENSVRRVRAERLYQTVADVLQIVLRRRAVQMIEHVTFRADRRAL